MGCMIDERCCACGDGPLREIGNIDCTIIAERPKISPHKAAIKGNLAKLLGCTEDVVNVKAKTHEKVDSLGENRSIACHTVVLLMRV